MAKSKAPKGDQAVEIALRVVVEATIDTPTYYANHAEIAVNQHELALWFARLPTKPSRLELEEARETGELVVDPEFQILVPPTLLDGLIEALVASKEKYESLFGPIRNTQNDANS